MLKLNPDYKSRFRILKGGKISLVVSAFIASTTLLDAAPSGGVVTSGSATISQSATVTNITQSTQKASINWQKFGIASNETVNFNQTSASSITLNRIIGNEKSIIDGAMNANGQVWILNSNGVLFGKDASINTAGLLATTKALSDADFNAGNYNFKGESTASVINMGTIEASDSGYVALLANTVSNEGTIKAIKGTIHLTGASEATINLNGNSLVNLKIDKGVLDALVENKGAVIADGGKIFLTTNAVDELLKGVVNNSGVIEANSLDDVVGYVELFAHGGMGEFGGTIEADGGFIETSGATVNLQENLNIRASGGEWLIDPYDFTIDAIAAGNIETALNNGTSVFIRTTADTTIYGSNGNVASDGDITVASNISKTAGGDAILSLKAHGNIIVNDNISISSSADKLNTILWSDLDATDGGSIYMKNGSSITTNGGHLWMGGGVQSVTLWNGLTVGDGYAIGTSAGIDLTNTTLGIADANYYGTGDRYHYNGITLLNSNINTSGGDFKASGKSYNAQVTTTKAYIGVFIGGDYQISTSTGDIILDGISTVSANDNSWYNGVALGSANVAGNANPQLITTDGDIIITGEVNQNFNAGHPRAISLAVWGATNKLNIKTTSGDISLTGDNKSTVSNSANRAIGNDVDGYRFTEISSSTGNINITGIGANTGGYDIGFKNAIIKTDGTITLTGDTLNMLSTYSTGSQISSVTNGIGSLVIKPYTDSTTIGIGGATGTLALTNSYFNTNFIDGFSNITIGSANAGAITVAGTTNYNNPLTLKTADSIIFNASSSLVGLDANDPSLVLWSDADANSNGGTWLPSTSSITTNGSSVTIGGGANPVTDYAFGADLGALDDGESNAGYRGATINGTIAANGGNIIINGEGSALASYTRGVSIGGAISTTGSGTIAINGIAKGTSDGVGTSGTISSENGNITLIGTKDTGKGTNVSGGSISATGSGNIFLTSLSGTIGLSGNVSTNTGTITLNSATDLTQGTGVLSGNALVLAGTSAYTLTNTSNAMSSLSSSNTLASFSYVDSNALSIGAIASTGAIDIATLTDNLTINGNIATSSTATNAITLNAGQSESAGTATGGNIIHTSGTISTGSGGRATLFTGSYNDSTGLVTLIGSGSGNFRYNADETTATYTPALGSGVYAIYREAQGTGMEDTAPPPTSLTYTLSPITQTYNGTEYSLASFWSASSIFGASYSAWALGSDYVFLYNGNSATGFKNAGTYSNITVDILKSGYTEASSGNSAGSVTITPKPVNPLLSAQDKVYDGTTNASISLISNDIISGDSVSLSASGASFDSKHVGVDKLVSISGIALVGNDAANYQLLSSSASDRASITPRPLSLSASAQDKVYDGTTTAIATLSLGNTIAGDALTLNSGVAYFSDAHAGVNKVVSIEGLSLTGLDASNYSLGSSTTTATATIQPRPLFVTADDATKYRYATDPLLSYHFTNDTNLIQGDSLSGALQREEGEMFGAYAIVQGSLANPDYALSFEEGLFTIMIDPASLINPQSINAPQIFPNTIPQGTTQPLFTFTQNGQSYQVFSSPPQGVATQVVSLQELRELLQASGNGDLRIPLLEGSLIYLVNGGVRLPEGVEQEFFIALL